MKYFTSEWWSTSGCYDEICKKYQEYYSSISSQLPAELRTLEQEHTLHDSKIESIHYSYTNNTIRITLNGWDQELNNPIKYKLSFIDVISFNQSLLLEDNRFGDLGFWEYEIVETGIEMRMLFDSSAQITIVFNHFEFKSEPRKA